MIEITNEQIERVNLILGNVKNAPNKVFNSVINRALTTVRSETGKQIREVYTISQKDLRAESNIRLRKAGGSNLAGEIVFAGCKIPLYRFDVTPKQPGKGTVKARVMKSKTQTAFEHAFIAQMKSGHTGIFERDTRKRTPVTEIQGLAVAQMAANSVVLEKVEAAAQETIDKRVEQEITRILNGYGG